MPRQKAELAGQRFGRLTVIRFAGVNKFEKRTWECRCDCGNTITGIDTGRLRFGHTQSCGCIQREKATETGRESWKHGMTGIPEYKVWTGMRQRCGDEGSASFKYYGGRGIKVCERWSEFAAFYEDMGPRPTTKHSLERINNDGNYEPGNCRWATTEEQFRNRAATILLECDGLKLTVAEWSRKTGMQPATIWNRFHRGWDHERILKTPVHKRGIAHTQAGKDLVSEMAAKMYDLWLEVSEKAGGGREARLIMTRALRVAMLSPELHAKAMAGLKE